MANGSASSCHSSMANSQVRTERSPVAHKGDAISVDLSPHPTGPTPIASAPELPFGVQRCAAALTSAPTRVTAPERAIGAASLACGAVACAGFVPAPGRGSRRLRVAGQVAQDELVDALGVFEFGNMLRVGH